MSEGKGGGGFPISFLISIFITMVVGVNMIPVMNNAIKQAKGEIPVASNVTQQISNPKLFSAPMDPTWALIILCLLMLGVVGIWIYTLYLKAKSQGAKV